MLQLFADKRESKVIPYLEQIKEKYDIFFESKHLTVGDYAICCNDKIAVCIERKSWSDLSASLRDGRSENVHKLLAIRESCGVKLCYLIEGDANEKSSKLINNIPIKNLRSHLDHLSFRDGISIIWSKNYENTAQRLFELAQNLLTIKPSMFNFEETTGGNLEKLSEKQISRIAVNEQILKCLPSVGSTISGVLAENKISLYTIYNTSTNTINSQSQTKSTTQNDSTDSTSTTSSQTKSTNSQTKLIESIAIMKYTSGKNIGYAKAEKIVKCRSLLVSKSQLAKKVQIRILACIPLISKQTAESILDNIQFSDIFSAEITHEELHENLKLCPRGNGILGNKAAANIIQWLLYHGDNVDDTNTCEQKEIQTVKNTKLKSKVKKEEKEEKVAKVKKVRSKVKKVVEYDNNLTYETNEVDDSDCIEYDSDRIEYEDPLDCMDRVSL